MADLPRFRDPRNRWPSPGDLLPRPLDDGEPYPEARAMLAEVVPTLSEEQRAALARVLATRWTPRTVRATAALIRELHPELFEEPPHGS